MAGSPKRRARREAALARGEKEPRNNRRHELTATPQKLTAEQQTLADLYAEEYTTFDALRLAMVKNGIVEHRINPYDAIQRAIDDVTTDYLLVRRQIEKDSDGSPTKLVDHPLYEHMERMREAMVRYSTFAMQYDIQLRQLKLSEARIALLSHTLRGVLEGLGLSHDQVRQVPRLLIDAIKSTETNIQQAKLDPVKAEAMAEILANDSEVVILDG